MTVKHVIFVGLCLFTLGCVKVSGATFVGVRRSPVLLEELAVSGEQVPEAAVAVRIPDANALEYAKKMILYDVAMGCRLASRAERLYRRGNQRRLRRAALRAARASDLRARANDYWDDARLRFLGYANIGEGEDESEDEDENENENENENEDETKRVAGRYELHWFTCPELSVDSIHERVVRSERAAAEASDGS